jgi:hypothetical protein
MAFKTQWFVMYRQVCTKTSTSCPQRIYVFRISYCLQGPPPQPRGLRPGSAAARLLGLRDRIPPGAWMSVSCECRGSG